MNPQQYPQQPGQTPGYPVPQGPPQNPYPQYEQQPYPGGQLQPGQWQQQPQQPMGQYGAQPMPGYPQQQVPQPQQMAPNGYNPYAYPGEAPSKQSSTGPNKAVIVIVIVVIALLGIIGGVIALSGSGKQAPATDTSSTTQQSTSNAGNDIVPRTDSTLDLTKKIVTKDTLKAQTLKAKTSEQVNLSSGFSFMAAKTEDYVSTNPETKPADGKKFIVVTAIIGNRKQTGNVSVSYLDFRLRDASNQLLPGSSVTNEILNNPLASPTELKPGEQLNGKVVFEVQSDDTSWVFKHSETYQKTTDDTTFTVEGEIVVQLAGASGTSADTSGGASPAATTP